MGVKGLWKLLLPIGRRVSIETLEGQILAIDASVWMTQFLKAMRDPDTGQAMSNAPLIGFVRRLCRLRYHNIRPVLVFDGVTPEVKRRELEKRRRRRNHFSALAEDANLQRLAKKLLLEQLKKNKQKTAAPAINPPHSTTPPRDDGGTTTTTTTTTTTENIMAAFAEGFHPGDQEETFASGDTAGVLDDGPTPEARTILPTTINGNDDNDDNDNAIRAEEEWEDDDSATRRETNNDWDLPTEPLQESATTTYDNDDDDDRGGGGATKNKNASNTLFHHHNNAMEFNVESIVALPANQRKDAIEQAQRNLRIQSRKTFMPAAAHPLQFSNVQITNFLKSAQLNKTIVKAAQQAALRDATLGGGGIGASNRAMRVEIIREEDTTAMATGDTTTSTNTATTTTTATMGGPSPAATKASHPNHNSHYPDGRADLNAWDHDNHRRGFHSSTPLREYHDSCEEEDDKSASSVPDSEEEWEVRKKQRLDRDLWTAAPAVDAAIQNSDESTDWTSSAGGFLRRPAKTSGHENLEESPERESPQPTERARFGVPLDSRVRNPETLLATTSKVVTTTCCALGSKSGSCQTQKQIPDSTSGITTCAESSSTTGDDDDASIEWEEGEATHEEATEIVDLHEGAGRELAGTRLACESSSVRPQGLGTGQGCATPPTSNEPTRSSPTGFIETESLTKPAALDFPVREKSIGEEKALGSVAMSVALPGKIQATARGKQEFLVGSPGPTPPLEKSILEIQNTNASECIDGSDDGAIRSLSTKAQPNLYFKATNSFDDGDFEDDWNASNVIPECDETAAALERGLATASRLTNWAGAAFRQAIRSTQGEGTAPSKEKPAVASLPSQPSHVEESTVGGAPSMNARNTSGRSNPASPVGMSDVVDLTTPPSPQGDVARDDDLVWDSSHMDSPGAMGQEWADERKKSNERELDTITDEMREEVMHLLQLFGVPYIGEEPVGCKNAVRTRTP